MEKLSTILFHISEKAEFDPKTEMSEKLLEYRLTSLEKEALEQGKKLSHPIDQVGFLITYAMCSEVITQITRLYLFQQVEVLLSTSKFIGKGQTVFGREIIKKFGTFARGEYTSVECFYQEIFQIWHGKLLKWRRKIDQSMLYEQEEIEELIGEIVLKFTKNPFIKTSP
jgi:hypothetical protein